MADTIAAIASARGEAGICVLRVSGDTALSVLEKCFCTKGAIQPRRLTYGHLVDEDGGVLDEVMAVYMPAPATYTREDVAEVHCHGGAVAADRALSRLLECGCRVAEPGEFTKRAFLNGRIDLARAEAVMALIGASGEAAARASVRQLTGGVSGFVREISEKLKDLLSQIEACTDFPDEVDEDATAAEVADALEGIGAELDRRSDPRAARLIREGASVVLAGKPNVGKSSLMNALLMQERAIVTAIPGTTRDVLTERIMIGGIACELSDTAGQRETGDVVERIGVDRAKQAVAAADVVIAVFDSSEPLTEEDRALLDSADERFILCLNKTDLDGVLTLPGAIELSAKDGSGMDRLWQELEARVKPDAAQENAFTVRRHLDLAKRASAAVGRGREAILNGFPLDTAAIDLKEALEALADITGENAAESVIDRVFAKFCVGK